jgi:hypothetical protein
MVQGNGVSSHVCSVVDCFLFFASSWVGVYPSALVIDMDANAPAVGQSMSPRVGEHLEHASNRQVETYGISEFISTTPKVVVTTLFGAKRPASAMKQL